MQNSFVISEGAGVLPLRVINECLTEVGICLNENEMMGIGAYLKTKMIFALDERQ